eukprot:jgi/Chlat1/8838/Chrsp91S08173
MSRAEATEWYEKAAEIGDARASCNLGLAHLADGRAGEAVPHLSEAAALGNARAQYSLALCLHRGQGTERDITAAVRWYSAAARGGNARAMYNLALSYAEGEGGLARDLRKWRYWLTQAANCGHALAQHALGQELLRGGDGKQALLYLKLAAKGGCAEAVGEHDALKRRLSESTCADVERLALRWRIKKDKC